MLNPLTYLQRFFTAPALLSIGFNLTFLITFIGLLVFVPSLRMNLLVLGAMLTLTIAYKKSPTTQNVPLLKGIILFYGAAIITGIFLLLFREQLAGSEPRATFTTSAFALLLYYMIVASVEEDIFRGILPTMLGSKLLSNIIYTAFHVITIAVTVMALSPNSITIATFTEPRFITAIIFTFAFGMVAQYVTDAFGTTIPAKGMHWAFDIIKVGLIFSILGGTTL